MTINSITNYKLVKQLGRGPVFLIGDGHGHLVIKAENITGSIANANEARFSCQFMIDMYKNLTESFADIRLLTSSETPMLSIMLSGNTTAQNIIKMTVVNQGERVDCFWYVMEAAVNCLDVWKIRDDRAKPEVAKAINLIQSNPKLMQNLGRIVAVDFFVANHDRFRGDRADTTSIPKIDNLAWSCNGENVFFLTDKDVTLGKFVGIDFYEFMNPFANFFSDFAQVVQNSEHGFWMGDLLKEGNVKLRDNVCDKLFNALVTEYKGSVRFTDKHRKEFREGVSQGKDKMKVYFKEIKKNPPGFFKFTGMPRGVTARIQRLGWS